MHVLFVYASVKLLAIQTLFIMGSTSSNCAELAQPSGNMNILSFIELPSTYSLISLYFVYILDIILIVVTEFFKFNNIIIKIQQQ